MRRVVYEGEMGWTCHLDAKIVAAVYFPLVCILQQQDCGLVEYAADYSLKPFAYFKVS